jgi:hypothetical protein
VSKVVGQNPRTESRCRPAWRREARATSESGEGKKASCGLSTKVVIPVVVAVLAALLVAILTPVGDK